MPWKPEEKGLLVRNPLRPLAEPERWLLVTQDISDLLDGKKAAPGGFPTVSSEHLIGKYCAGYLLTVSRKITKRRPDVEQIAGHEEVWAFCVRKPAPGWRLLGRFYCKDVFVALRPWDKRRLFSKYADAANEVIADWKALFGDRQPHKGATIYNYMSQHLQDLDEEN